MSKKLSLVFIFFVFFFSFHLAFANLVINEIMYDVSGSDSVSGKSREWIEVYNDGSSDVAIDASKWRIASGDTTKWTMNGGDDFSILANNYVIFAGDKNTFLADNPNFSPIVYDTGISSLNNAGEVLKILDQDGNVIDSVSYTSSEGGAGDGNSLQLINGSWVSALPTPGMQNVAITTSDTSVASGGLSANYSNNTSSNINSSTQSQNQTQVLKIKTEIVGKTFGFVGSPISLSANTTGHSGEKLFFGRYFWNFGDGGSKEISLSEAKTFSHTYYYPGDYLVSLDFYQDNYGGYGIPDASAQIHVKIIPDNIFISNVGDEKNFYIELTNNTEYGADISGWVLSSERGSFMFSRNTMIASKQKLIFPSQVTGLIYLDKGTLKLKNGEGDVISDYSKSIVSSVENTIVTVDKPTDVGRLETSRRGVSAVSITAADIIPPAPSDFVATAGLADREKYNHGSNSKNIILSLFVFVFIGVSAYVVYFIRHKNIHPVEKGSDFEILDE